MPAVPIRRLAALAAAIGLNLAFAAPASAITYCYVRQTADGFVTLRAAPDPASRRIARMRPNEEVLLAEGSRGAWRQAYLMRRSSGEDGYVGHSPLGWVHSGLIHRCY